jgi:hypothetical protein
MSPKKPAPPSQHDVERRFRELLDRGDIDELASWLDVPYDTLNKQLNPNNPTNKSDFYRAARLLWALRQIGEEKAWKAIDILTESIFPSADAMQLVNRMESDISRLKAKLTEGAR